MFAFVALGALVTGLLAQDCVDLDNQCQGWSRHCGIEVRYNTLSLGNVTLHYVTLRYIALRYVMLRYVTLRYIALRYVMLRYVMLQ